MTEDRRLPESAKAYSKTAVFTGESLPAKLGQAHNTKAGVWGCLNVLRGEVRYYLEGDETPLATVSAGETFIIKPAEWHFVRASDDVEFFVEFFK